MPLTAPALAATTPAQMSNTAVAESAGRKFSTDLISLGVSRCRIKPAIKGPSTICEVDNSKAVAFTGTNAPASRRMSSGIMNTARRVEERVSTTENATSALPRRHMTLLATPPGQTPTSMAPAAREAGRLSRRESRVASVGIRVY